MQFGKKGKRQEEAAYCGYFRGKRACICGCPEINSNVFLKYFYLLLINYVSKQFLK